MNYKILLMRHLLEVRHRITHDLWDEYGSDISYEQTIRRSVEIYREGNLFEERNKIRQSVDTLLQNAKIIYDCGGYEEEYGQNKNEKIDPFCDRKTISTLLGPILTSIFFAIRPVLYCDEFIKTSFPIDPKFTTISYIRILESLIIDDLTVNQKKDDVFRTKDDATGSTSKYRRIIRLPDRKIRCDYYDPPPEPGDSPDGNG